ncbi:Tyrosine recombinase XerC [uncultured Clostridium sp.]|uniref:tyrosine-type recombinase/integrase n=1 Tax=uncultured Clostridium sp. TaxID=59620 RepID=UPI00082136E3|nr:site-specific integrase [uncultured Clostridium sp.]SCJ98920.1 Tyrosine recombinase XerC [uncultured Clostridium sp.]
MAVKTNCTINGKDYYRITMDIGIDSNGKRIRKQFLGKNKKEAEQKKLDFIKKRDLGISNKTYYLGETMNIWLYEVVKVGQIKPTSFSRYAGIFNKYFKDSAIAHLDLTKITPLVIQRYYNDLYRQGKSSNVIKTANKLLKQFFNYCIDNNYIIKNPCDGKKIVIPKDHKQETISQTQIFQKEEMKSILENDEDTKIRYIALISYATGMRRGEILGLSENDIDYSNNVIHIRRSVSTTYIYDNTEKKHKETYISDTKTYTSNRDIPLPKSLIPVIKKAISLKKRDMVKAGPSYNKEFKNLLFLTEEGNLIEASNIDKSWVYFLKRCKVAHKKFHALRHTYATLQFENDRPLLTVSKLLGHSSIDVTANTYVHILKKEKEKAIDTLELLSRV